MSQSINVRTSRHNQSMHGHLPRKPCYTSVFVFRSKKSLLRRLFGWKQIGFGSTWNHLSNLHDSMWLKQFGAIFFGQRRFGPIVVAGILNIKFGVNHLGPTRIIISQKWVSTTATIRRFLFFGSKLIKNKDPLDQWIAVKSEQPLQRKIWQLWQIKWNPQNLEFFWRGLCWRA